MRRGTIVLLIFVLIAAAIVGATFLLQNQPPLTITLAVDPLIEDWAKDAVAAYNASNPIVGAGRRVQVTFYSNSIDDLRVWNGSSGWTATSHPDAWIASSTFSTGYARERNIPLETVQDSLAKTPLIFGGYASRINVLTGGVDQPLTWAEVNNAANKQSWAALGGNPNWQFVNLAFAIPDQTMSGLAVILSLASSHHQTVQLTSTELTDTGFRTEASKLKESVSNFNTIGQDVAAFVSRGTASADIGIAPESQWLRNLDGILKNEDARFSYPDYIFVFDFPLTRWEDPKVTDDTRQAVDSLGNWLLNSGQQEALKRYGLRPVSDTITAADGLFADAETYGIQLNPVLDNVIQAPPFSNLQALTAWLQSAG